MLCVDACSSCATIVPNGLGVDGHAVVATALDINNDLIERGEYRDLRSSVLDKICVCLAGPEAERIKFGDADASGDVRQIKQSCNRAIIFPTPRSNACGRRSMRCCSGTGIRSKPSLPRCWSAAA
jgi:hypothetical protein